MELTSLGRAHLATVPDAKRKRLFAVFRQHRGEQWPALRDEIEDAIDTVARRGFCAASWQPEVVALAAPVRTEDAEAHYVMNLSVSTSESTANVVRELSPALLALVADVELAIARGSV
jgi:DNA-binding IclR family transcriptional regulator